MFFYNENSNKSFKNFERYKLNKKEHCILYNIMSLPQQCNAEKSLTGIINSS